MKRQNGVVLSGKLRDLRTEHALETQAFAALTGGDLEVTVEGWLRSAPGNSVVVVDRAIYLNVTQAQRDQVARLKAASRRRAETGHSGRPGPK